MPINLLETVQENLGYPPLQKIETNTQKVKDDMGLLPEQLFSQAAIPSVLIALSEYSQDTEQANHLLMAEASYEWSNVIFGDSRTDVMNAIALYCGKTTGNFIPELNEIGTEAVRVVKAQTTPATVSSIQTILKEARNDVLPFLPPSLQIGVLLHDNTLDDGTNKMQGPISSLMQAIGGSFSGTDSDEIINSK